MLPVSKIATNEWSFITTCIEASTRLFDTTAVAEVGEWEAAYVNADLRTLAICLFLPHMKDNFDEVSTITT